MLLSSSIMKALVILRTRKSHVRVKLRVLMVVLIATSYLPLSDFLVSELSAVGSGDRSAAARHSLEIGGTANLDALHLGA